MATPRVSRRDNALAPASASRARRTRAGSPDDVGSHRSIPGRSLQPSRLPATVVVVLVPDTGQPVRGGDAGRLRFRAVAVRLLAGGGDRDTRNLQLRSLRGCYFGRSSSPLPIGRTHQSTTSPVGRGPFGGLRHGGRRVLLQDPEADVLDLVAQRRRALELELLRSGLHLGFHLGDQLLDLRSIELAQVPP